MGVTLSEHQYLLISQLPLRATGRAGVGFSVRVGKATVKGTVLSASGPGVLSAQSFKDLSEEKLRSSFPWTRGTNRERWCNRRTNAGNVRLSCSPRTSPRTGQRKSLRSAFGRRFLSQTPTSPPWGFPDQRGRTVAFICQLTWHL